jgi:hypothetical protein
MHKLTTESIAILEELLSACTMVKIDKLKIEPNLVSGIDEDKSIVLISETKIPDFGGMSFAVTRLSTLNNRINLMKDGGGFEITAEPSPNKPLEVCALKLNNKATKSEFKATNPEVVKTPKSVKDNPSWLVTITAEMAQVAAGAANNIGAARVILSSRAAGGVHFEMQDDKTQDTFSVQIADEAMWVPTDQPTPTGADAAFVHYYNSKTLMPLIKAAADTGNVDLIVTSRGILQLDVKGFTFTIIPKIQA